MDRASLIHFGCVYYYYYFSDDAIKVFVRVRPLDADSKSLEFENNECLHVDSMSSITMLSKPEPKLFTFDRVAGPSTTQVR